MACRCCGLPRRQRPGPGLLGSLAGVRSASSAVSDGPTDLAKHGRMTWQYDRAEEGNVALTGRVDRALRRRVPPGDRLRSRCVRGGAPGAVLPARGFATTCGDRINRAGTTGRIGSARWLRIRLLDRTCTGRARWCSGRTRARRFPAARSPASRSPGGSPRERKRSRRCGGYHLVWPRDLAMSAVRPARRRGR